ncbi:MAG: SMP-30/gluconolactonase/LRE family protein [Candidatus Hydrogenedentes bacterium]|nr:SMP-30/gluconolactonase/LRE family protein [Candidatus Hydrogenedentota bacterium]
MIMSVIVVGSILSSVAGNSVSGAVELVADGFLFTEGPVWLKAGVLVFSDIPADAIYRADKSVYRKPSGKSNGLTMDNEGRLIACEHWNRRVTREEPDGTVTVLAERYEGKRLNSPNDVVVRSDGAVFFTDPPYGLEGRPAELDFAGVYLLRPDGTLRLLIADFVKPNGLALSPDEKTLYIADTDGGHIRAFMVASDGTISDGRLFCNLPRPDGMKVDVAGNVWCTAEDGVRVMQPDGSLLTTVRCPQAPANCAFGDQDFKTLYVTARTAVYRVRTTVAGISP